MKDRIRTCSEIASARGRHARERARTGVGPISPLRGEVAFAVSWLTSVMSSLVLVPFRGRSTRSRDPAYVPTPRELGVPGPLRHRSSGRLHGRYGALPSMSRLLRDLRRPAARAAARAALMARIGGDDVTLAWAVALLDGGDERRLALHARAGVPDAEVIAAWRSEARAEKAAAEADAKADLLVKISDANRAEEGEGGQVFSPPRS